MVTVAELMSTPAVTARPDESVAAAAARMHEHHIGSLVVTNAGRCAGIVTERDVLRQAASPGGGRGTVAEWMTPDPVTVTGNETWNRASELLRAGGFRHLPVVDDAGALLGLVSLRDLMKVAYLMAEDAVETEETLEAPRGLEGVAVARTALSDVWGRRGFYHFRGYDATAIARHGSVEDAWYLLYEGDLPTRDERDAFADRVAAARRIPAEVHDVLPAIARHGTPGSMAALRTAASLTGQVLGFRSWLDQDPAETKAQAMRIAAVMPMLAAALSRLGSGLDPVDPPDDEGYAASYLHAVTGDVPDPDLVFALERYLVCAVDHGFNNSTFTARVIASSGGDIGSAVTGAIGALEGPLHGGAIARAPTMLDAIGTPDNVEPWMRAALGRGERLMGFGHAVYKTIDPRTTLLREIALRLGGERAELARTVERVGVELLNERKPGRRREANVDFYAGVVLEAAGIPEALFGSNFAVARTIGWTANVLEQIADNRIFRPSAHYVGPQPPRDLPAHWTASSRERAGTEA